MMTSIFVWLDYNDAERRRTQEAIELFRESERSENEEPLLEFVEFHEARHTASSLCIAAGVDAKALQTYVGHSSITTTFDRYGHLMPDSELEHAAMLDAYLERSDTRARLSTLDDW